MQPMAKKAVEEWDDDVAAADKTWTKMQEHFKKWYDKKMKFVTTCPYFRCMTA
jgi:hypothetical protein